MKWWYQVEIEAKDAEIARLRREKEALVEFAQYVVDMDPSNPAPLFERARAALRSATETKDGQS